MPAHLVVLYNAPKDPGAFERYYAATHLPLLDANARSIGHTKAEFVKFASAVDGSAPSFYRKAELTFESMDALRRGLASEGFKKVGGDLGNFATGGFVALIGELTNRP